jgi:hypothetical protein
MTAPSTAARLARQAERLDTAISAATAQVTSALPGLSADEARAALEVVVPLTMKGQGPARFLEELVAHMAENPEALISGDPRCSLVLIRLTHVLHDAGQPVVRPGCARCGKIHLDLRHGRPEGRICGRCGRLGKIARNAHGDQPDLCDSCYRGPERTCSRCGRVRPCQRITSDEPICHTCYARDERPRVTCARCERDKPVMTYWPIGPVCQSCYTAIVRSPAECARCQEPHPLY